MSTAVEEIVGRLRLSGLVGFDFLIEEQSGDAYLIEMNLRAPQMGHLQLGSGRDLPGALRAVLAGEAVREAPGVTENRIIALFPQEWQRDPASRYLRTAYHDVPWEEPDLVRACMEETVVQRFWCEMSSRMSSTRAQAGKVAARLGRGWGRGGGRAMP
jgi:hypothetical protein